MKNFTDEIFKLTSPYDNKYQGEYPRLLFVCSAGLLRSATASHLFAKKGFNTRCCGSSDYALVPISHNLIAWAHKIYFMNNSNYLECLSKFKKVLDVSEETRLISKSIVLDIPDNFEYRNKRLIKLLKDQVDVKCFQNT